MIFRGDPFGGGDFLNSSTSENNAPEAIVRRRREPNVPIVPSRRRMVKKKLPRIRR
jgi:hypothetical protein